MTCIVAIAGKVITMGADSLATANNYRELRRDDKIFRAGPIGEYVVGFSSDYRAGQILRFHMEWPAFPTEIKSDEDVLRFFVTQIVPVMHRTLEYHWTTREDGDQFDAIIATGSHFVVIPNDGQVAMVHDYAAIGSGSSVALGALDVLTRGMDPFTPGGPERIVRAALGAAERHDAGVSRPFVIMETLLT